MEEKQEMPELKMIDLESLLPPDNDIRVVIPEERILELAESIKEVGLIQAITVVEKDGKFEIVIGHRRFLAVKKLGLTGIRAEIRTLTSVQKALMRATENLQRDDLSYMEEAAVYANLYHEHGFTLQMIADKMGKAIGTVKGRLDLLNMDSDVQNAIHHNKITPSVAVELSKIDDEKVLQRYLTLAIDNGVTAAIMAQWAEDWRKGLAYSPDRGGEGGGHAEATKEQKHFTMCELCEGPAEYKDIHNLLACTECFERLMTVVAQGHFKESGPAQ